MKVIPPLPMFKRVIVLAIATATWIVWLIIIGYQEAFSHLISNWQIALTMLFGSMIAGGTSIGGGAVAFPVFTKLLHISPHEAKVFSLAIQSVGMSAASLAICLTGIRVEWRVIRWGSLGGLFGIFLGLGYLAPVLPPDVLKMSFTIMLTSFAITLFTLNQNMRQCRLFILSWQFQEQGILFLAGFFGGIMSGLVGNGIDIVVFSVMVLLWRISEKVATPTSVILMAINAIAGFILQIFVFNDFTETGLCCMKVAIADDSLERRSLDVYLITFGFTILYHAVKHSALNE
ncbi:sulfite exporter TauE/SafE family protein, partial [Okeania sp. SIO2B3]|uniref:sulfite exporter TauE/SafE family protein n=1 Tax=Okeania sp. SIO2B3 TaxID=2607784 RepID=UPI0013C18791